MAHIRTLFWVEVFSQGMEMPVVHLRTMHFKADGTCTNVVYYGVRKSSKAESYEIQDGVVYGIFERKQGKKSVRERKLMGTIDERVPAGLYGYFTRSHRKAHLIAWFYNIGIKTGWDASQNWEAYRRRLTAA